MRFFHFYIIRKPDIWHRTHSQTPTAADVSDYLTNICGGGFMYKGRGYASALALPRICRMLQPAR